MSSLGRCRGGGLRGGCTGGRSGSRGRRRRGSEPKIELGNRLLEVLNILKEFGQSPRGGGERREQRNLALSLRYPLFQQGVGAGGGQRGLLGSPLECPMLGLQLGGARLHTRHPLHEGGDRNLVRSTLHPCLHRGILHSRYPRQQVVLLI